MIDVLQLFTCKSLSPACISGMVYLSLPYFILPYFTLPLGRPALRPYQFGRVHNPHVTGLCLRIYVELCANDNFYACSLTTENYKFKVTI